MEDSKNTKDSEIHLISTTKPKGYWKIFISLVFLAIINNAGYNMVSSSAQALAKQFDEKAFVSFFSLILSSCNVTVNIFNSKFLLKVAHITKIRVAICLSIIGYLMMSTSILLDSKAGFFLSIAGTIVMGVSFTLGLVTCLGYLKAFNPLMMAAWGIGAGLSNIISNLLNFTLRILSVPGYIIFIVFIPTALAYILLFSSLETQRIKGSDNQGSAEEHSRTRSFIEEHQGAGIREALRHEDAQINLTLTIENLKFVWPKVSFLCVNMVFIMLFDALMATAMFDGATREFENSSNLVEQNAFVLLMLAYGVGVVTAKGSLNFFRIPRVGILTILNFMNLILWTYLALSHVLGLFALLPLSVWVGMLPAASYVNSMYIILHSEKIPKEEKEICINLLVIWNFGGGILGTLIAFFFEKVIFPDYMVN